MLIGFFFVTTGCVNRSASRRSTSNSIKPPPPVRRSSSVTPSHQLDTVNSVCSTLEFFSILQSINCLSQFIRAVKHNDLIVRKLTTTASISTRFDWTNVAGQSWRNGQSSDRIESYASQSKCFATRRCPNEFIATTGKTNSQLNDSIPCRTKLLRFT